MIVLG